MTDRLGTRTSSEMKDAPHQAGCRMSRRRTAIIDGQARRHDDLSVRQIVHEVTSPEPNVSPATVCNARKT